MPVKVSVVIPVYNPGEYIEDCIASLLRQSLPDDEYEAIFVNDGSTDETPARLDRLAAEHPHMRVIHQEASGWSGKPRNAGIAAARGEYVMFVDNDDWLGDEALERMYEYGVANEADMVIGKMAGKGRPVPLELFRVNRPRASVENAPLIDSLTPHKMLRKEFLDRHDLRFMEGRRRLEDHVFVAEAYLLAENISVLSDYLCYYHVKREDASNAGFQRFDPVGYFTNLREALDVVERHTEPGALRDKLFRRWLRNEMVERLRGKRLLALPEDYRKELFAEIRGVVTERFGPGVAAGMQPIQQIVTALIVADRLGDVEELARWEAGIRPTGVLESLGWEDGRLEVAFTAEYEVDGEPLRYRDVNGKDLLDFRLADATREAIAETGVEPLAALEHAKVDLVVRERATAAEFFQTVEFTRERLPEGDGFRSLLLARSGIDSETAANGAPLGKGIWDVLIRISASGWTKETRLGSVRADDAEAGRKGSLAGSPRRLVLPYWTEPHSNLSLDVDHATSKFDRDVASLTVAETVLSDGRISFPLPLAVTGEEPVALRFKRPGADRPTEVKATLTPGDGGRAVLSAALPTDPAAPAEGRVELGLPSADRGKPRWTALPLVLTPSADGTVRVRHAAEAAAKAAKAARDRAAAVRAAPRPSLLRRTVRRVRRALSK